MGCTGMGLANSSLGSSPCIAKHGSATAPTPRLAATTVTLSLLDVRDGNAIVFRYNDDDIKQTKQLQWHTFCLLGFFFLGLGPSIPSCCSSARLRATSGCKTVE